MLVCMRLGPTAKWPRHIKQEGNHFFIDSKVRIAPSRASPSGGSNSKECPTEIFTLAVILWTWMILITNQCVVSKEYFHWRSKWKFWNEGIPEPRLCWVLSSDFWVRVLKGTTHRACSATSEHLRVRRGKRSRRRRGRQKRGSERCVPHFFEVCTILFRGVYHTFF